MRVSSEDLLGPLRATEQDEPVSFGCRTAGASPVALGTFLAEKTCADQEKRELSMTKACAQFNDDPFTWDDGSDRTKLFVVFSVDHTNVFAVSSYLKLLVGYCSGTDSSQDTGQSQ